VPIWGGPGVSRKLSHSSLARLLAASVAHRIDTGPHTGRKGLVTEQAWSLD